jgi:predicted dehydrogenase
MGDRSLGVGVVGLGLVGAEHVKAYLANPACRVLGLVSRATETGEAFKHQYGLAEADVHTELAHLLDRDDIDVVSICTPNSYHVDQGIAVARAGKHLVLEKPIALDIGGARRLADAVDQARIKSVVGLLMHWYPRFMNQLSLVRAGAIGEVFLADCEYLHGHLERYPTQWKWTWRKDMAGGSLLQGGIHAVDAMLAFIDSAAVEVTAYSHRHSAVYEYDPTIVGIVRFANGAVAKLTSSFETEMPYQLNLRLYGTGGTIQNDRLWSQILLPAQADWATAPAIGADSGDPAHHPFTAMVDHVVDAILTDGIPYPTVRDALRSHEVAFAANRSAELRRPVPIPLDR